MFIGHQFTRRKGGQWRAKSPEEVKRNCMSFPDKAGFSKNGQITGRRSVAIPVAKSQRFQSGFRPSDRGYNPLGRTYSSRTATKPSFETSRGKNWCAYVHTRLSPTVVIDSTYVPIVTDPCYWSREGCHKRYQMMSRPTYKIKHKISTSLEWRCCPGYVGPQCQPKVESATQIHQSDRRAEVHSDEKAAEGAAPEESQQATQPGIKSKMDYEDMNQEKEITFFLKKVNGISMDIDTMKKILSSLEEKVNEKGDDLPSVMKALKTKAIQDTLREIVQEEMKSFQSIIQESISKILKDLSTVSEENEAINDKLAFERQEGRIFADTVNHTLSQSRAIHGQPLEGESITGPTVPDNKLNETHNLTEQVILLGDIVRHQALVNLQLQQDMLMQELRIQNFTNSIGQQRQQVEDASEALVQQCKQDLLQQMLEIKDSIRIVNQTLSDKVEPMDDMMTAIEEKMSHVSYELEELKPIKEHNGCADVRHQEEHSAKLSAVEAQVDGLAAAINIFNISINDLQKAQKDLRNQMKDKEEEVERKLNVCQDGIEDALNDTMTVINKAIDSVNDNPYLNCILAGIFQDISGLQRYAKELDEWLDGSNTQNGSSVSSGRSLRNTDNIVARESQRCNLSPCANGGTCIDTQSGYVCACRTPFGGSNCTVKLVDTSASHDFSKGSYRYAPMVTFFVAHTYGMSTPGPIRFNHMYVNYGASYSPGSGKFNIPYLGVYVFKYTIEYTSPGISGYLVEDGVDKLAFRSGESAGLNSGSKIINGDAVLELNYGQQVWLRLETGSIPVRFPPVTTFGGYLLYRT
ncbi:hypothetical protein GJAV_G00024420 [Gymnothorax javanicus]|nr:hypothetical protein GJAV_G00024420 [Gymnothorax javanicus]